MVKKVKSRYGDERTITLLEDGSYKVEGRSMYSRFGDGLFDFEGGPCYIVGDRLLDVDDAVIIESIEVVHDTEDGVAACILNVKKEKKYVKLPKKSDWKNRKS
jgi:hypothetical protein